MLAKFTTGLAKFDKLLQPAAGSGSQLCDIDPEIGFQSLIQTLGMI
jgi:hypothetical protein